MDTFFQQLFTLLTVPPGNLVYHLTLSFSVMAALTGILVGRRTSRFIYSGRLVLGLSLILAAQLILFIGSGLVWQGMANAHTLLPPLERAFTAISLIWAVWLWAFPRPSRGMDVAAALLTLAVMIFFLFTLISWSPQNPDIAFNDFYLDWVWQGFSMLLLLGGLFALLLKKPDQWGVALGFVSLSLAGAVAQFLGFTLPGDYAAAVRLSQLCAYPLLPFLGSRLAAPELQTPPQGSPTAYRERRRYTADPRAVHAWLQLASQQNPHKIVPLMARAVGQTMLADLCYLVTGPSASGDIILQGGYDLIREDELPGTIIESRQTPTLAASLQRGRPLLMSEENNPPPDLEALGSVIGVNHPGNALLVPLANAGKVWGGLLLFSPYAHRNWNTEDQSYLGSTTELMAQLLQHAAEQINQNVDSQAVESELTSARRSLENLQHENQRLQNELLTAQQHITAARPSDPQVEALIALQQESQEIINALREENEHLRNAIQLKSPGSVLKTMQESDHLENELRLTLEEVARLQNKLAEANMRIMNLEQRLNSPAHRISEEREVIASIAQELRQPMASITGYTDLLLSESVGILGALQRKFMERVKSSTERMRSMLDDLIQMTALESDNLELVQQQVDLGSVIDQAVADTSAQLREKKITLRVEMPDEMPQLNADRDALQQIMVHLLQNAGTVTPMEGTVGLRVRVEEETPSQPYLLLQVVDNGGGIAADDLPRVFARRYRADNALVQGVGDTGVGLSITKTLVEAHGGRIWVDTETGQSSTFSVLFPLWHNHEDEPKQAE